MGLLGYGRRYLDRTSPALSYLGEASYPVYLLHQTVIVIAAFYVVDLAAAEPLQWLTLMVVSVAGTFALYEVVRRIRGHAVDVRDEAAAEPRGEEGPGGRRRPQRRVTGAPRVRGVPAKTS